MATWNTQKSIKQARADALAGTTPPTPPDFTDIGTPPIIDVGGVESVPNFFISGVVPERVDLFSAELEEPIERWPARPRGVTFSVNYKDLDSSGLDSEFIAVQGLTYSEILEGWTTYFPIMYSNTQLYTQEFDKPIGWEQPLVVGMSAVFLTTESLDPTSYVVGRRIYGREFNNQASVRWSGTIVLREDFNTMEVAIDSVNGNLSAADPSAQYWYISNNFDVLENAF